MKYENDTLNVFDTGNNRIQKFNGNGTYLTKMTIAPIGYSDFVILNNKYYLMEGSNFSEYTASGERLKSMFFSGSPSGFSPNQKQFVVIKDKVVFQDSYTNKLFVFTK